MTEDEFTRVFTALYGDILDYAVRRTDEETAEEVVLETLMTVWTRWPDAPQNESEEQALRRWTFGVARKVLANAQRAKFRSLKLDAALKAAVFAGVPVVEPDHGPVVDAQQTAVAVFRKLPPRDQELLEMVAWEGLSVEEVASILDLSPTVVGTRLARARHRLITLMRASGLAPRDAAVVPLQHGPVTMAPQESAE